MQPEFTLNQSVTVSVNHGHGALQTFNAKVKEVGSSHLRVTHETNKEVGEWLPIHSSNTNIKISN